MRQLPKAFIFDLDGVITDTAEFHYLAWKELADSLNISIDRAFNENLKGVSRMESLNRILALDPSLADMPTEEKVRLATEKNESYKRLIQQVTPEYRLPGIETLIKDIKAQGIQTAIGSASKNAAFVLERLELTSSFDYIVDAAKVTHGKPHPETFTTAADYLNIPYEACIGVEDAEAGVEAINRANMYSVAVGDAETLAEADFIVSNTSQLILDDILKQYANQKANKSF